MVKPQGSTLWYSFLSTFLHALVLQAAPAFQRCAPSSSHPPKHFVLPSALQRTGRRRSRVLEGAILKCPLPTQLGGRHWQGRTENEEGQSAVTRALTPHSPFLHTRPQRPIIQGSGQHSRTKLLPATHQMQMTRGIQRPVHPPPQRASLQQVWSLESVRTQIQHCHPRSWHPRSPSAAPAPAQTAIRLRATASCPISPSAAASSVRAACGRPRLRPPAPPRRPASPGGTPTARP